MMLKKTSGFTIVELLMVTFIIGLISALILTNYRGGQKRYALEQATQKLVSDIRKSQNMAMSGVDIEAEQYYGYGIYVEQNDDFYIIYADENGNSTYQPSDATIETTTLPSKIEINSLSPLFNKVDIFFKPPDPITYINGNDGAGISGTITLILEGASLTNTVTITTAGLIYSN